MPEEAGTRPPTLPTLLRHLDADRLDPSALLGRVPHGEPLVRRIARAIGVGPWSTREARELEELAAGAQRPVTTGRRIGVTSVRGGAGKSAVSALLGMVFAARRGDPVLAADAGPEGGSLAWRLGLPTGGTMAELAPRLLAAHVEDLRSLAGLLPRTPAGLWLLPGGSEGQAEQSRDIARSLSRLFAVSVIDCAFGSEAQAEAHAVVLVTPANPDGVRSTRAALDQVAQRSRGRLARMVVVLNTLQPVGRAALRPGSAAAALAPYRLPVVSVPFDRHVGGGSPIDAARLAEPTLLEVTRLAALALRKAASP